MQRFNCRQRVQQISLLILVFLSITGRVSIAALVEQVDSDYVKSYKNSHKTDNKNEHHPITDSAPRSITVSTPVLPIHKVDDRLDSYSFATPFVWTFEVFLVLLGLISSGYLYKRLRPRINRTR